MEAVEGGLDGLLAESGQRAGGAAGGGGVVVHVIAHIDGGKQLNVCFPDPEGFQGFPIEILGQFFDGFRAAIQSGEIKVVSRVTQDAEGQSRFVAPMRGGSLVSGPVSFGADAVHGAPDAPDPVLDGVARVRPQIHFFFEGKDDTFRGLPDEGWNDSGSGPWSRHFGEGVAAVLEVALEGEQTDAADLAGEREGGIEGGVDVARDAFQASVDGGQHILAISGLDSDGNSEDRIGRAQCSLGAESQVGGSVEKGRQPVVHQEDVAFWKNSQCVAPLAEDLFGGLKRAGIRRFAVYRECAAALQDPGAEAVSEKDVVGGHEAGGPAQPPLNFRHDLGVAVRRMIGKEKEARRRWKRRQALVSVDDDLLDPVAGAGE